jgi:hypothetical protein
MRSANCFVGPFSGSERLIKIADYCNLNSRLCTYYTSVTFLISLRPTTSNFPSSTILIASE